MQDIMPRLTTKLKLNVIRLLREKFRIFEILRILKEQHNFSISRRRLSKFIRRYETTGELSKSIKNPRPFTKQTDEILEFVDQALMERNDETTAPELVKMVLEHFKLTISETTLKRTRRRIGWLSTGTKYCQLVREANRVKRLEYCQ